LTTIARDTGFITRERGMSARDFMEMNVFAGFSKDLLSLNDHSSHLSKYSGKQVSRQAIDKKFTVNAVSFMKKVLGKVMAHKMVIPAPNKRAYNRIIIQDGTRFKLHDCFMGDYPGYNNEPVMALQLAYDLENQQACLLEPHPGKENDASRSGLGAVLHPGDLLLRDLAYYGLKRFAEFNEDNIHYISKLKAKTQLFSTEGDGQKIDLGKVLRKLQKGRPYFDMPILVGKEKKVQARAVITLVPEEKYQEAIKKATFRNRRSKSPLSKEYKQYARLNILITNLDKKSMGAEEVRETYSKRWQVELVFKTWKSLYGIHKNKKMKKSRFECYIYSTLVLALFHWKIYILIKEKHKSENQIDISLYLLIKELSTMGKGILKLMFGNLKDPSYYLSKVLAIEIKYIKKNNN
jgi:hypothetical protein